MGKGRTPPVVEIKRGRIRVAHAAAPKLAEPLPRGRYQELIATHLRRLRTNNDPSNLLGYAEARVTVDALEEHVERAQLITDRDSPTMCRIVLFVRNGTKSLRAIEDAMQPLKRIRLIQTNPRGPRVKTQNWDSLLEETRRK